MTREEAIKILHPISDEYCQMANIRMTQAEDDICEALDMAIKALKAEPCKDAISRQAVIALAKDICVPMGDGRVYRIRSIDPQEVRELPAVQPDHTADSGKKVCVDIISRQAALKELAAYIHLIDKTMGKGLLTDDDCMEAAKSVLGEDELPSAQPATNCSEIPNSSDDTISRQAAIDALARMMPRSYTPDGSHPGDEEIFRAQEVFADCIEALEILPSAQPEIIRCKDCKWKNRYNCTRAVEVFIDDDKYCAWAERRTDE